MSDVQISLYTSVVKLTGENVAPPSLPPSLEETQPAINPPGTSDISGLVPYNGAIDDVNLGEQGLSTGFVQYDTTPTDTPTGAGTVVWNPDKYTLDLSMGLGDSVQQIGMETYYTPVKNQTGSLIPDGTFVMATGSLGNSGRITVAPAVTNGSVDSRYMLGVTTHDIADGEDGLVTWFGEIRGFNTNIKAPVGETWIDGTVLWNNPAVAGGFTSVEPQAPNLKIPVAIVISAGNNGVIFVRPRLGMRLTDLHDVDAFTPSDKNLISYDSALGHWNAKSLGSVIGGTSSQFLKGDGSLDSNSYALASSISGTTNYIPKFTASGTIGNSQIFDNGTNVGIGTLSIPNEAKLFVDGQLKLPANLDGTDKIGWGPSANNIRYAWISPVNEGSQNVGLALATTTVAGEGIERMRITHDGNVGIGTNAPTNTLDINGTARIRSIANASGNFLTTSATGVIQQRTASETLADIGGIGGSGTTNYIPKFTASGTIGNSQIFDNGTNVGIGTLSIPNEAKLFVDGQLKLPANLDGTDKIGWGSSANNIRYAWISPVNEGSQNVGLALATTTVAGEGIERMRITHDGNVGIGTNAPTNTLDVNGTARIRSLTGTTGYLPLLSSTGVMGQSVVYNTSAGSILIGTINEVSGHKVRISGGALNITNWQSSAGAYDKLSIDFGEFRGIGYDADYNEVFFAGTVTVPVKIDTDAPTDSLNVLSTGGLEMKNLQAGTISDNIGLNSSGELVKGVAGLVQSVSGTAVDNTDPLNPIISVDNWTSETLIDTITLNDTNGNVTYTCNSTITIFTNSKLNIKTLYLNITNIASSGIPLGGAFEIKGYNFYNFIGANDISVLYEVKEFRGTSYTESLLPLLRPDALGTIDGQLIFRKINNTQQQPPFTSTNGEITIKIAKFKQS